MASLLVDIPTSLGNLQFKLLHHQFFFPHKKKHSILDYFEVSRYPPIFRHPYFPHQQLRISATLGSVATRWWAKDGSIYHKRKHGRGGKVGKVGKVMNIPMDLPKVTGFGDRRTLRNNMCRFCWFVLCSV